MSRVKWPESVIASSVFGILYAGVFLLPTCVYASVILQVSSSGELLAAVLLLADEGLLTIVSPHVNLQPLQHIETLPTALCTASEHPVIPGSQDNHRKQALVAPVHMLYLETVNHKLIPLILMLTAGQVHTSFKPVGNATRVVITPLN